MIVCFFSGVFNKFYVVVKLYCSTIRVNSDSRIKEKSFKY